MPDRFVAYATSDARDAIAKATAISAINGMN